MSTFESHEKESDVLIGKVILAFALLILIWYLAKWVVTIGRWLISISLAVIFFSVCHKTSTGSKITEMEALLAFTFLIGMLSYSVTWVIRNRKKLILMGLGIVFVAVCHRMSTELHEKGS